MKNLFLAVFIFFILPVNIYAEDINTDESYCKAYNIELSTKGGAPYDPKVKAKVLKPNETLSPPPI